MKRSAYTLFVAACTTALLLAGCAEDPSDNTPDANVEEAVPEAPASESAAAPMAEGKTYTIASDSSIEFVGSKVTGSHDGGFKEFSGTVTVPEGDLTKATIDITITMSSTYSDNDDLTTHLLSPDFFDGEKFPESTFVTTAIAAEGDGFNVTGNLTLHGVTKSITFPASMALDGDTLTANAEFDISRFDFDIKYAGKADDLIRENVVIKLDITATAS